MYVCMYVTKLEDITQPSIVDWENVFQPGALLFWELIAKSVILI